MPVFVRPRQPAHLQTKDDAHMIETHFGQQALEAEPSLGRGAAQPLILIDDLNLVGCPAERDGPVDERVLPVCGFPILDDLLRGGLADVHDGSPFQMTRLNLRSTVSQRRVLWIGRIGVRLVLSDLWTDGKMLAHWFPPFLRAEGA